MYICTQKKLVVGNHNALSCKQPLELSAETSQYHAGLTNCTEEAVNVALMCHACTSLTVRCIYVHEHIESYCIANLYIRALTVVGICVVIVESFIYVLPCLLWRMHSLFVGVDANWVFPYHKGLYSEREGQI